MNHLSDAEVDVKDPISQCLTSHIANKTLLIDTMMVEDGLMLAIKGIRHPLDTFNMLLRNPLSTRNAEALL